jgi:phosphinothricin acetyltransferase
MALRTATIRDVVSINNIYNQAVAKRFSTAHLQPLTIEEHLSWFLDHNPGRYPIYIYEQQNAVAGWISLSPYRKNRQALEHVAEVSYYVHNDYQGKGIGAAMMEHVLVKAPDFGFTVLIAILLDRNIRSIGLLEKFGFKKWGNMPGIARIEGERADHLYYGLHIQS